MSEQKDLLDNLFRAEFAKMVAVISKRYGLQYMEMAEDIVSDTFLTAAARWERMGTPAQPTAWLYHVARQKTLAYFRRDKILTNKVIPHVAANQAQTIDMDDAHFSQQNIKDSLLQMLFAICHPAIGSEAQIGLALRILCGFSIEEIAEAFLTNKETINKRLFRAKERLRMERIEMEIPSSDAIRARLDNTLHIIYLLFTEGYYSRTQNQILRLDLCREALRLGIMLTENTLTNLPKTNALVALMCFHASRFHARQTSAESFVVYADQDERDWNQDLIQQGMYFLGCSAAGDEMSSYHLEARIAYCHCSKADNKEKWEEVLRLYNQLLLVNYSPAVALNRTYALYKSDGREVALHEAEKLQLSGNHFYYVLLGELYTGFNNEKARANLLKAQALAKTTTEKQVIQQRLDSIVHSKN